MPNPRAKKIKNGTGLATIAEAATEKQAIKAPSATTFLEPCLLVRLIPTGKVIEETTTIIGKTA